MVRWLASRATQKRIPARIDTTADVPSGLDVDAVVARVRQEQSATYRGSSLPISLNQSSVVDNPSSRLMGL